MTYSSVKLILSIFNRWKITPSEDPGGQGKVRREALGIYDGICRNRPIMASDINRNERWDSYAQWGWQMARGRRIVSLRVSVSIDPCTVIMILSLCQVLGQIILSQSKWACLAERCKLYFSLDVCRALLRSTLFPACSSHINLLRYSLISEKQDV